MYVFYMFCKLFIVSLFDFIILKERNYMKEFVFCYSVWFGLFFVFGGVDFMCWGILEWLFFLYFLCDFVLVLFWVGSLKRGLLLCVFGGEFNFCREVVSFV